MQVQYAKKTTSVKQYIVAVTVTYGSRWNLLKQVIQSVFLEGVDKLIIVNNGATDNIEKLVRENFEMYVIEVVNLDKNYGSSKGFCIGMKKAYELNPDFILFLDDDNVVQLNCISSLVNKYAIESQSSDDNNLALLAFRPVRLLDVANGISPSRINPLDGSFFGLHFLDIPFKLWKRIPFVKELLIKDNPTENVYLQSASWSGLFIKPDLIKRHGYPNEELVLYADDTEYTLRISQSGGKIALCTEAVLKDIDQSWNLKSNYGNTFDGLLLGNSEFRAYYSTRNQSYLEYHKKKNIFFVSNLNRLLHRIILTYRALVLNKKDRFKLLINAINDGKNSKLGVNDKFPLN